MTPNAEAIPLFPDVVNNFGAGKGAFFVGLAANNANYSEFAKDKIAKDLGAMLPPILPDAVNEEAGLRLRPGPLLVDRQVEQEPRRRLQVPDVPRQRPKAQQMIFKSSGTVPEQLQAKVTTPDKVGSEILGWVHDYPLVRRPDHAHPRERGAASRQGRAADHDQAALDRRRDEAGPGRAGEGDPIPTQVAGARERSTRRPAQPRGRPAGRPHGAGRGRVRLRAAGGRRDRDPGRPADGVGGRAFVHELAARLPEPVGRARELPRLARRPISSARSSRTRPTSCSAFRCGRLRRS